MHSMQRAAGPVQEPGCSRPTHSPKQRCSTRKEVGSTVRGGDTAGELGGGGDPTGKAAYTTEILTEHGDSAPGFPMKYPIE